MTMCYSGCVRNDGHGHGRHVGHVGYTLNVGHGRFD